MNRGGVLDDKKMAAIIAQEARGKHGREEGEKGETVTAEGAIRQQMNRGGRNKIK